MKGLTQKGSIYEELRLVDKLEAELVKERMQTAECREELEQCREANARLKKEVKWVRSELTNLHQKLKLFTTTLHAN
jgi:hypothetical protein